MSEQINSLYVCTIDDKHIVDVQPNNSRCPKCPTNNFTFMSKIINSHGRWKEIYEEWIKQNPIDDEKERLKKEFDEYLKMGDAYLVKNQFQDAIDLYKNAKNLNIDNLTVESMIKKAEKKWDDFNKIIIDPIIPEPSLDDDYGLCILLMDASGSMNYPAYDNYSWTKKEIIAKCAAHGIWDLEKVKLKRTAYITAFMFDNDVDVVFPFQSVEQLIQTHRIPENLEKLILDKLNSKDGQTNINGALELAYHQAKNFINGELKGHFGGEYKVLYQGVTDTKSGKNTQFPNVRVFLYTDGEQIIDNKKEPLKNPFTDSKELKYDILMGGYFGPKTGEGHDDLESVLGSCPEHNVKNFFEFDDPSKLGTLKNLFQMSTGASGFCPQCLEKNQKNSKGNLKDVVI